MASKRIHRENIPEEFRWNTAEIYESDAAWLDAVNDLTGAAKRAEAMKGMLGENGHMLLEFFKLQDEIRVLSSTIYGYASCNSDQDTTNALYQNLKGKGLRAITAADTASSYAVTEILALSDEQIEQFYSECPQLHIYKRSIDLIRRRKGHILSEEGEKLLASAGEISESPDFIYSILCNSDLRFNDVTDSSGETHTLSDSSFVPLLESPDRDFRKAVFSTYYGKIREFKNTLAAILNAHFKQMVFFANARNYKSTLTAALDSHEIPTDVYFNLIHAVHSNIRKMYRYVDLRKKLLGVQDLHMYDVYTPLVPEVSSKIPYEEAKQTVLKALSCLGEDYIDLLEEGFGNRWIDVYENEGKRSGAYSSGNAIPHPYVLLNYKDNLDSMFTLAHEMGHALHSYYSRQYQPQSNSDYVIFVAEVASTCNEVLLMNYLLNNSDDKKQKAYLINHFLDQFKGTVFRQTMFAELEQMLGEYVERGETLTADMISAKYYDLNHFYFGPHMVLDEGIELEWARIPHFYYNYYVFQYATGFSAAVAIANRILNEGAPAVADYKRFLQGGCSTDPISLLKIAGVDMSTPGPVNDALRLFDKLLKELQKLTEEE